MASQNKPLRIGRLRDNERGRGWRAKLYGPSDKVAYHRVAFKDQTTKKWVYPTVPEGVDPDVHFEKVEIRLNNDVAMPAARSKAPTMTDLKVRYLEVLRQNGRDETYVHKVENLLDVWVIRDHGNLEVRKWTSRQSRTWIAAARKAGRSGSRVEDLGTALSGMRSTARSKDENDQRWMDPGDDPLENVNYTRMATEQGVNPTFVPVSLRPTPSHVDSVLAAAAVESRWHWLTVFLRLGIFCGPRLAELMALRAVDIDFTRHKLLIRNSVRWPRPKSGVAWGLKRTKTKMQRETPYPASLDCLLLPICKTKLGLGSDVTLEDVIAAQEMLYDRYLRVLDDATMRTGTPRPISPHECLLFTDPITQYPPTKEQFNDEWRRLRSQSTWPVSIPWRNARHHTVMWWRTVLVSDKGVPVEWFQIGIWLGNSAKTLEDHYVRNNEDADAEAKKVLDNY